MIMTTTAHAFVFYFMYQTTLFTILFLKTVANNKSKTWKFKKSMFYIYIYIYTVDFVKGAKWFINMLCELALQCTNGVSSNLTEGRTKYVSVKNLTVTLKVNVQTLYKIYLIQPGVLWDLVG